MHVKVPIRWFDDGALLFMTLEANAGLVAPGLTSVAHFHSATIPPIFIADVNGLPIPGLADFDLHMLGAHFEYPITLTPIVDTLPGDYNQDGVVNALDYLSYRKLFGLHGHDIPADGNGNFEVDEGDYTYWRRKFRQSEQ